MAQVVGTWLIVPDGGGVENTAVSLICRCMGARIQCGHSSLVLEVTLLRYLRLSLIGLMFLLLLVGCDTDDPPPTPTLAAAAATLASATETAESIAAIPPTWTAVPVVTQPTATAGPTQPAPATSTSIPTVTLPPATETPTPTATATNTAVPTATPVPPTNTPAPAAPAAPPTISANPVLGGNLLVNGSFEEGWYNQNGIPELQLPNGWTFGYEEGPNPFDSSPVQNFVRPETRVLSKAFLPPFEHPIYILDGEHTIKMFKGYGATHFWLYQDVALDAGVYVFEINAYPDMVVGFENGQKVFAGDPASGEIRFIVGSGGSGWYFPAFGVMNKLTHTFTLDAPATVRIGVAFRGRYAIDNNGWFVDNWSLRKVEG